jgi:2'-5' RNA ligase
MIRLFVALKIPHEVRSAIVKLRKVIYPDDNLFKWEPEEKIHLTLKFIGEVKAEIAEEISSSLKFVEEYKALRCQLNNFGFFYRKKDPVILWAGLNIDESVFEIVKRIEKHLTKFNIPEEKREFNTHITLLRIKRKTDNNFINKFL